MRTGLILLTAGLLGLAPAAVGQTAKNPAAKTGPPRDPEKVKQARGKLLAALKDLEKEAASAGNDESAGRIRRWMKELIKEPTQVRPTYVILIADTAEGLDPPIWRYTEKDPGAGWDEPGFDDFKWAVGMAPFGSADVDFNYPRTIWRSQQIWLRTTFLAPRLKPSDEVILFVAYDDNPEIYINGELCMKLKDWSQKYAYFTLTKEQAALIRPGENTLAVTCRNTLGAQVIDVGIAVKGGK